MTTAEITPDAVFSPPGEMSRLMRTYDWASSPLGPVEGWPRSLRTIVHALLGTRHPMFLFWGGDAIQFYNDAYRPSLGAQERHPAALGARGREFWAEIWDIIGPQIEAVMQRGESTWNENHLVPILRNRRIEEVYWTYSYSPVLDDDGQIGGTLVTCQETTGAVLTHRRMALLQRLADQLTVTAEDEADLYRVAAAILGNDGEDLPFGILYALDSRDGALRLCGVAGDPPDAIVPAAIRADAPAAKGWPAQNALGSAAPVIVEDLAVLYGAIYTGPWPEPVRQAVLIPIAQMPAEPIGVLIAGISSRLTFDDAYRSFLGLIAGQIGGAVARARALQDERRRAVSLAEREERARLAIELAQLGTWTYDPATNLVQLDERMSEIWGEPSGITTLPLPVVMERIHRDDRERTAAAIAEALTEAMGGIYDIEYRIVLPDGTLRWITVNGQTLFEGEGADRHALRFMGTALDVTVQKNAIDALRASEERLDFAASMARLGPWSLTIATETLSCTAQCKENFGRTPEDTFTYKDFLDSIHPGDRDRVQMLMEQAVAQRVDYEAEYRVIWPDGSEHWIAARGRCAYEGDVPTIVSGITLDITDRHRVAEATRAAADRANFRSLLVESLRPLANPVDVERQAAQMLGQRLSATRVNYCEIGADDETFTIAADYTDGVASITGRYRLDDFGRPLIDRMRSGETCISTDVGADAMFGESERNSYNALDVEAYVAVPLIKDGRFVAALVVHQRAPRLWTDAEIALIEEVAERTWGAVERARAESASREREERYRTLFTSIDEGYCLCELILDEHGRPADYRFLEINPHFADMTGMGPDAVGQTARKLVPSLEDWWIETYGRVALTGEPARFQHGSEAMGRTFDVYVTRVGPAADLRFAIVFNDISERRRAEAERDRVDKALRASQERMAIELHATQRLQAISTQMIREDDVAELYEQILDAAAGIMQSQFASIQLFHAERGPSGELELLGHRGFSEEATRFWSWVRPDSSSTCGVALRTREACVVPDVEECAFMAGTDELATYRQMGIRAMQSTPLLSRAGQLVGMISTHWSHPHEPSESQLHMFDVLARQAADLIERRKADVELRRALAAKDEFLGLISHELRTPITTVLGNAEILLRHGDTLGTEARTESLRDVHQQAQRLDRIIADLLTLARAERGALEAEPLSLNRSVRDIVADYGREAQSLIHVDERVPSMIVNAESGALSQIIRNYLSNAEKYGAHSEIEVLITAADGEAHVCVRDRGIGIKSGEAEQLFDAFYRSKDAEAIRGIGIGLSVCKRLAEAIGGRVWAAPRDGGGSEFGLALPLHGDGEEPQAG